MNDTWKVIRRDEHTPEFVAQVGGLEYREALNRARTLFNQEVESRKNQLVSTQRTTTSWMADYRDGCWTYFTIAPEA